jgi:hypothetical protein
MTSGQLDAIELISNWKAPEGQVLLNLVSEIRHLVHLLDVREMVQKYQQDSVNTAWGRIPIGEWSTTMVPNDNTHI